MNLPPCCVIVFVSTGVRHLFFFFKQKTAYEIVSRDWSSDVCSSDLEIVAVAVAAVAVAAVAVAAVAVAAVAVAAVAVADRKSVV